MSRLGIFTSKAGPSKQGSLPLPPREDEQPDDDWYIPYNGPIEQPPKSNHDSDSRDSWGEMLHEVLSEEEDSGGRGQGASRCDARQSHAASAPEQDRSRSRAISNASRQTRSTGAADSRRNTNARAPHLRQNPQPRGPTMSFVNVDQLGGVGGTPTPIERTAPHIFPEASEQRDTSTPSSRRESLASIFTFGRRKSLRMSASADNLARERARSNAEHPLPTATPRATIGRARANTTLPDATRGRMSHEDEYYNSYYSTLLVTPGRENGPATEDTSMRSHPYAYPFPQPETAEPQSAPPAVDKGKGRLVVPRINFLEARGAKVPAYLKPSPRNSLLKASMSAPNLKGRQRWLAAESWCDAIILPRPRFALRLVESPEGGGSGRIVSPPPSPVLPGNSDESIQPRPGPAAQHAAIARARSMSRIGASSPPKPEPAPQPEPEASTSRNPRPPRPKSWAWDDLALPSPVPSLAKVLEQGRQLEEERKAWQAEAGKSFLDKRANNVARARSKSIGAPRTRSHARSRSGERKAFEALAEKTLLGNQTRPPTIHVHSASVSKTSHHTHSHSQTQSATAHGTFQSVASRPFSRSGTGSRTMRSHAHSNSVGNTISTARSDETPPSAGGHAHGHSRNHSLGKSAFKIVVSTANSAAAFCGLTNPSGEKGIITPLNEKADAMDNVLQHASMRNICHDQIRPEDARSTDSEHLVVIAPTSPTAFVHPHGSSPTPSGLSGSVEVGIAISPPDDHSRQYQGREPIRIPAHPYAQGSGYVAHPVLSQSPESYGPSFPTHSNRAAEEQQQVNRHRQPVQVHPYAQGHPYATPIRPKPPPHGLDLSDTAMYAELTPGHVREFAPDDIRYSPEIPPPMVIAGKQSREQLREAAHPYAEASKRTSELVFGDALMRTMRRTSIDSGIGTSDYGEHEHIVDRRARTTEPEAEAVEDIVRIHGAPGARPVARHEHSGGAQSNHTIASSPLEHAVPPAFRRTETGGSAGSGQASLSTKLAHSSGSSPGIGSHDSSPPLSPRPIDTTDDLERFRDLFYRPSNSNSSESMARPSDRPSVGSRRPSGSIPFDVQSRSTGLSTLARQLSEDLEDMRNTYGSQDSEELSSDEPRMWGRRYGGLRGPRPDDVRDEPPNIVLARFRSRSSSTNTHSGYDSPVRLPIDTSFVSPTTNIPEDVESSRASSVFELSPLVDEDRPQELLRVGAIEAVSTPPIIHTPQRHSHDVSLIGHSTPEEEDTSDVRRDSEFLDPRLHAASPRSTLLSPLSPNTRSSYMTSNTDTSRMSGLSDFPTPPTVVPSVDVSPAAPPRIVREPSLATFGRQDSASSDYGPIGEAI